MLTFTEYNINRLNKYKNHFIYFVLRFTITRNTIQNGTFKTNWISSTSAARYKTITLLFSYRCDHAM